MPIGLILYLAAFFAVLMSAQDLWTNLRNRAPEVATCAQFTAGSVSGDWIQLNDCRVDYLAAVKTYQTGKIDKSKEKNVVFYAPVWAASVQGGPVALVIKAPADMVGVLEQMFAADAADSKDGKSEATEQFLSEHAANLMVPSTTLSGLRQTGMHSESKVRDMLQSNESFSVGPNWSILDTEDKPAGVGASVLMMALALTYIGWRTSAFLRRSAAQSRAETLAQREAESPTRIADLANPRQ